jgi:hypothetical protein
MIRARPIVPKMPPTVNATEARIALVTSMPIDASTNGNGAEHRCYVGNRQDVKTIEERNASAKYNDKNDFFPNR